MQKMIRGKGKCFGYSLLPLIVWNLIQAVVFFAGYGDLEEFYVKFIAADGLMLILGYFWFRRLAENSGAVGEERKAFDWKAIGKLLVLGLVLQFGVSAVLDFLQTVFPKVFESYREVLETLGMFEPTFYSVLYTAVLAPLAEELIFRGLTLRILEREFPFWMANIIQAAFFGMMHGNVVQGVYGFLAGLVFGRLVQKYHTMKAPVFCHFVVNFSGIFL